MSNTEKMVSVPRELVTRMIDCAESYVDIDDADLVELRDILTKPAEQHQGEPVAYICKAEGAKWLQYGSRVGEPWNPGEVQVKPLYAHADPAEVERLRAELAELRRWEETVRENSPLLRELDRLRAKLAERDSLLRMVYLDEGTTDERCARVEQILAASAEPSATKCNFDMRTRLVGDGCAACNPERAADLQEPSAPVEIDHDALVAAVCVLRSQGLGNLSAAVEEARAALERKP